jgi:two-component system, chemotaxis family, sensor kinase CheA
MNAERAQDVEIDLRQFHGLFFADTAKNLTAMEQQLLDFDIESSGADQMNVVFRAVHSIKGGAATFGFENMMALTREMESVFDRVRKGVISPTRELIHVFFSCAKALKVMLAGLRDRGEDEGGHEVLRLRVGLRRFLEQAGPEIDAPSNSRNG